MKIGAWWLSGGVRCLKVTASNHTPTAMQRPWASPSLAVACSASRVNSDTVGLLMLQLGALLNGSCFIREAL